MKLILLGTGGYHPNERRHTACVMIPETGLILDAGTAIFRIRDHLETKELDIFLTHAHLDHVIGLTYLLDVLYETPVEQVRVHGEENKLNAIKEHLFSEELFPVVPKQLSFHPLSGPVAVKSGKVTYFPLEHPGGSIGYRLDFDSCSIAYVTDTSTDANYLDQIQRVDLLLHECNFRDEHKEFAKATGHSSSSNVAEVAKSAAVRRLVLIHINSMSTEDDPVDIESLRAIFPHTEIAEDGLELSI